VIFLFMPGGPSQVDTFDPKPTLTKENGKPSPKLYLNQKRNLLASPWKFEKKGRSGLEVSELFPHVGSCADRLCVIRSMIGDDVNHPGGCLLMNTGERVATRPSLGAWVTYGLGTENQDLPGFIAIGPGPLIEGGRQYGAAFLPAAFQGTFVSDLKNPIRNLKNNQVAHELLGDPNVEPPVEHTWLDRLREGTGQDLTRCPQCQGPLTRQPLEAPTSARLGGPRRVDALAAVDSS
jgi:hypothetical protein